MTILSDKTIRDLCTGDYQWSGDSVVEQSTPDFTISRCLPGTEITNNGKPMIEPFVDRLVRENDEGEKIISYGLTSYGYDVRIKDEVKLFTNVNNGVVDPMSPDEKCFVDAAIHTDEKGNRYFILPPNSYALAVTEEYFRIPENVMVVCVGKSTYARSAILINTTPIEAGFEGEVVIEIGNGSNLPVKVYVGMGIAQFMFFRGNEVCEIHYGKRSGKYQGQRGITHSRV
jgi:dCTP deaminase